MIGVDISQLRLEAAGTLGAEALDGSAGLEGVLASALWDGEEIDMVFECSGVPALANTALDRSAPAARSWCWRSTTTRVTFNPTVLVQKEIRLQGSIAYTGEDFADAVELLRSGKAKATPLITQRDGARRHRGGLRGPASEGPLAEGRS